MIHKKLFEIQKMGLSVTKNGENTFFKDAKWKWSKYVTLDALRDVYQPILCEMNILCIHKTRWNDVFTYLIDMDDETEEYSSFPLVNDNNPQKHGSCITYAKRYNLWQLLNIMTDQDDDWNKASIPSKPEMTKEHFEQFKSKKDKYSSSIEAIKKISEKFVIPQSIQSEIHDLYIDLPTF